MIRKVKFGKIAIVIFLTILIWVWTDLYLDEELSVPRATISVAHTPELLVSFSGQPEALINNIQLKGPAKKISEVRRYLADGTLEFDFTLNPGLEGMISTGSRTLNVLDFLKRSDKIKEKELSDLTIEGCEPEIIDVSVVKLVKKPLEIDCFDENGVPVTVVSKNPEKVEMFVPEDSRLRAQVRLTSSNINQARLSEAIVFPYVELAPGRIRNSTTPVRVKMSPQADSLIEYPIDATLGTVLSMNLVGEYDVDITNYNDLVSFSILATHEAKIAYENQPYQIILYILDDYAKKPDEEQRREVVPDFPDEYIRKDQIRLKNPLKEAKFKLIPLKSSEAQASGPS
jgi:hypothetical protein